MQESRDRRINERFDDPRSWTGAQPATWKQCKIQFTDLNCIFKEVSSALDMKKVTADRVVFHIAILFNCRVTYEHEYRLGVEKLK